ncbi:unnamed protein product [Acanthoscelides obtectus]|uniref:Uncharacterized protein n=1 Tax=Acanthoscelides obtectus TaxID=200917 RepID=A0A9P0KTE7_ACAOB|nr:unnamed protein product [Acanthoscelides obtectus]CAK1640115.1 hypothetical protein AOBTE_LOCUS11551 [Acanthoscelides obtectus]
MKYIVPLLAALLLSNADARRIRVQPPQEDEAEPQDTINYYAAEPQEEEGQQQPQVVLVSSADRYNGLYGQQSASSRREDNLIHRGHTKGTNEVARTKESKPPVQTIRNYSKVNDDGSFTFGYEAADGSFKEETRGTDCVVRGKYGYVDPDGNKREFTYVSGNPCDPNAPKEEEQEQEQESNETENGPANYPTAPIQPIRRHPPPTAKPAVTLFQNAYQQQTEAEEEEQPEPEQVLRPTPQPVRRPTPIYITRPSSYLSNSASESSSQPQVYQRQATTTPAPASVIYRDSVYPISVTPRPIATTRTQHVPTTTYRPQLLQATASPRPNLVYTKQYQPLLPTSTISPIRSQDFSAEFHRFQQENNILSATPSTLASKSATATSRPSTASTPIYSTALIYDPSTGQYNNQLYQSLPQSEGDIVLKQRIQPYVHQAQGKSPVLNVQQLRGQHQPLYQQTYRPQPLPSQASYQQQQAELQFQNSAQLYAQQQKARQQQQQQQQQQQRQPSRPQPIYYVQPSSLDSSGALASSQIDAFLRGHNIQF